MMISFSDVGDQVSSTYRNSQSVDVENQSDLYLTPVGVSFMLIAVTIMTSALPML